MNNASEWLTKCSYYEQALAAFKATWSIVRKNGMSLERVVATIAHAAVFVDPEQGTSKDIMDLNDSVDCMEAHCNEVSSLSLWV